MMPVPAGVIAVSLAFQRPAIRMKAKAGVRPSLSAVMNRPRKENRQEIACLCICGCRGAFTAHSGSSDVHQAELAASPDQREVRSIPDGLTCPGRRNGRSYV